MRWAQGGSGHSHAHSEMHGQVTECGEGQSSRTGSGCGDGAEDLGRAGGRGCRLSVLMSRCQSAGFMSLFVSVLTLPLP